MLKGETMTGTAKCAYERIWNSKVHTRTQKHTQWSGFILCTFDVVNTVVASTECVQKFCACRKLKYGHHFCFGYFDSLLFSLSFNVSQQYINNIYVCAWTVASILLEYLPKKNYRFNLIIYHCQILWNFCI